MKLTNSQRQKMFRDRQAVVLKFYEKITGITVKEVRKLIKNPEYIELFRK